MNYAGVRGAMLGATGLVAMALPAVGQVQPLSGEQINEIARNITVLIVGKDSHGSGAIISRSARPTMCLRQSTLSIVRIITA